MVSKGKGGSKKKPKGTPKKGSKVTGEKKLKGKKEGSKKKKPSGKKKGKLSKNSKSYQPTNRIAEDDSTFYKRLRIYFPISGFIPIIIVLILYLLILTFSIVLGILIFFKNFGYNRVAKHFTIEDESGLQHYFGESFKKFNEDLLKLGRNVDLHIAIICAIGLAIVIIEVISIKLKLLPLLLSVWFLSLICAAIIIAFGAMVTYSVTNNTSGMFSIMMQGYHVNQDCFSTEAALAACRKLRDATVFYNESMMIGRSFYKWKCCGFEKYSETKPNTHPSYWPYWCCSHYGSTFDPITIPARNLCIIELRNELCMNTMLRLLQNVPDFKLFKASVMLIGFLLLVVFLVILMDILKATSSRSI